MNGDVKVARLRRSRGVILRYADVETRDKLLFSILAVAYYAYCSVYPLTYSSKKRHWLSDWRKQFAITTTIMALDKDTSTVESKTLTTPRSTELCPEHSLRERKKKKPLKRRIREILWDSFDRTPEERWFIHKIDFFILTWASLSYFSKNLNTNNVSKSKSNKTPQGNKRIFRAGADTSVTDRQCLRFWYEGGPQYRWERVPNAHDYVDDVSCSCRIVQVERRLMGSVVVM